LSTVFSCSSVYLTAMAELLFTGSIIADAVYFRQPAAVFLPSL
jgi:hypothetical protein